MIVHGNLICNHLFIFAKIGFVGTLYKAFDYPKYVFSADTIYHVPTPKSSDVNILLRIKLPWNF